MTELTFKAKDFEGPLDLLLTLVAKKKMSLFDVDLIALIDDYLVAVKDMQERRLELASEFIEMAAQLVYLKSLHLLPKSDEGERLKQELTGQLIEYALCKQVAVQLGCMRQGIFHAVREPAPFTPDCTYKIRHSIYELVHAHKMAMGKGIKHMPTEQQFDPIVTKPIVSVSLRIKDMIGLLKTGSKRLVDFFRRGEDKSRSVATFLAVLELLHAGNISLSDTGGVILNRRIDDDRGDEVGH